MAEILAPFSTVHAPSAMVASADHLATQAGVNVLAQGGSAADAAIATNAVLAVVAPHLCGMGGDLFALVHPGDGPPVALNASGRAGSGADPDRLRVEGYSTMPMRLDPRSVTVPGCVDGWLALHERFGLLPLAALLVPAISYAVGGFPASPLLVGALTRLDGIALPDEWHELRRTARRPGELVRRPGAARALTAIAAEGHDGFYGGEFGDGLIAVGAGEFAASDLVPALADWVEPLAADAWGHRLWTVPPNSQGYVALSAAAIASGLPLPDDPDDSLWPHLLIEAAVQASHDRPDVLWDGADGASLMAPERLGPRRAAIDLDGVSIGAAVPTVAGDTTYLCAVDGDGMGVSLIQSNASGFGSYLFEPNTSINLHNRGLGFSLVSGHGAEYGPGRRPPHTLSPLVVTDPDGGLRAVVGTQGGDGQPQILVQVLARLLANGQAPGRTIGAPRWVLVGSGQGFDTWTAPEFAVAVEAHAPEAWFEGLARRGHPVRTAEPFDHQFGHANLIALNPDGVRAGASDPRARIAATQGF